MSKKPHVVEPAPAPPPERALRTLVGYSDAQLRIIDPLEMNLLVAKEIPSLTRLSLFQYKLKLDQWANDFKRRLRDAEKEFAETPWHWKNDLSFFRLGFLCQYLDQVQGIRYREDQRDQQAVFYTDPNDLFLNGVIDSRQGTCANMAALHVAIGWRMRWPVSLACVGSHLICRFDDGKVTHNIEATRTGGPGFHSHPDAHYLQQYKIPSKAVACGSDLRAVKPREMLGIFVGLRARHYVDTSRDGLAEPDYLLARHLFPNSRHLHYAQVMASVQYGMRLFEPDERGHPVEIAGWLRDVVSLAPWEKRPELNHLQEASDASKQRVEYRYDESGREN